MLRLLRLAVTCGLLFIAVILAAQSPDLSVLEYRLVGPHRGGRVGTVTGVPQQAHTFYFGASGGGVWKTRDAGTSWHNVSGQQIPCGSIGAVAVAPSDPEVVYVGTGSANLRGNVSSGIGMYKSMDAGENWTPIGLHNAGQIAAIQIHPRDPDIVYVAVLGSAFGPNVERGVFRTLDGGAHWEKVLYQDDSTGAIDLVMDPQNPRILYAGLWTAQRLPWTLIDGSASGGVYKSTDAGDTWQRLEQGLPQGITGRVGIAVSPADHNRIWVLQEAVDEKQGGLFRSDDGGKSFIRINRDHELRQRAWYYSQVIADPVDAHTVYVLNVSMHRSTDGGTRFETISTPHSDHHALWIHPDHPQVMINGNDGGACITLNGGRTWSSQRNQPTAEFYRVTVDEQFPYRLYGAQQDNSTVSVPSAYVRDLFPEQYWYSVGGGESGHIAVDPRNPDIIYAGNYIGQITRMDRSRDHTRDVVAYPQMHDGQAPRDIRYRFQWNAPIRLSPHDPDILYHCSQFVHRSRDGGQRWEVISPDLTTNNDAYQDIPGGPVQHDHTGVELYTTIFSFEESPLRAGELWAGTDDGRLHISRNNGESWAEITPAALPSGATINTIELSRHQSGRAYVAAYRYRENDVAPYIFATENYGASWTLISQDNGIPSGHFVRVVREDMVREDLLFAGTEFGMYYSINAGEDWHALQQNLPVVPITDLQIKAGDLVVATQGRSFWILDDLSALRQERNGFSGTEAVLYQPGTAYITQLGNFRGDAVPDPAPTGAIIQYYLPETTDSVQLEIIDPRGQVRRIYGGSDSAYALPQKRGLNRLQWDLRYEAPNTLEDAVFSLASTAGVSAMPGTHRLRLHIGGKVLEQQLDVQLDPRWTQTAADLRAQHDLTVKVKALLEDCHDAILNLRFLRKQLYTLEQRLAPKDDQVVAYLKQSRHLRQELDSLEGQLIQVRSESGQDPINYPPMLDDQIAYLYSIVNGQYARPTEGSYTRYADVQRAFSFFAERLETIATKTIPRMNEALRATGFQMIQPGRQP